MHHQSFRNRQEIVVRSTHIRYCAKKVSVSRERIAKRVENLKTTQWQDVIGVLSATDISEEDYYCLDIVKRSRPLTLYDSSE